MRQPENKEEVLALGYTAKECYKSPSYYAFGDVEIPTQSEYEIDLYVTSIRKEDEAERIREREQRDAAGRG